MTTLFALAAAHGSLLEAATRTSPVLRQVAQRLLWRRMALENGARFFCELDREIEVDLAEGSVIGRYTGEACPRCHSRRRPALSRQATAQARYHRDAAERQPRYGTPPFGSGVEMGEDEFDASPSTGLYAMRTNGVVIDGEDPDRSNYCRFINHSATEAWEDDSPLAAVYLETLRDIAAGEELLS
ncbi:hypothetical protein EMIHUDRAFT_108212 [Emiliania huxleyi CCMP1516]|uniref:SET domain-containing protein n=2 Tax=Emiliania huxleyi TaxID=2903 RepID=A0A0D3KZ43_EMIH1|nr:hypothetical protein EMIHUDRAFT_108210 [Emiliania huxleyi CCMP1516]XP_005793457.1 hypothetical protein EMIHUDRAFT_108212 [Emiliania huxleyi CCMP1516]EOD41027.1 hypothetical protein EMIHUDRAFT_108210 [Emiliania huxleyi CCMP1516]EOD41028.1 hypothetical protein EMIHUDRAFT_108212 [Emiliania huxleyi CCMP1516]|eukprot:XP_005793456.1 hypothetical protein EMIHUDRAFT_108210 [Emiliania huxleyi CCMP1516]